MASKTCRHPSCFCDATAGSEFCSESCHTASGDAAEHARCDCGHDACSRRAATGDLHAGEIGESGRVGYLVLYLMGVPVGVLLLLWVLFGNNLLGAGEAPPPPPPPPGVPSRCRAPGACPAAMAPRTAAARGPEAWSPRRGAIRSPDTRIAGGDRSARRSRRRRTVRRAAPDTRRRASRTRRIHSAASDLGERSL